MTKKSRVEKLEKKIEPKAKHADVGHFNTSDYKDQAELDRAIEKWHKDHPRAEGQDKPRIITHITGIKGEKTDD